MAKGNSTKRALTEMANRLTGFSVPSPNLPEEIIIEILLRLPVKSILRFRCVSKSWLSLISSPKFVKAHFKISSKNNMGCHNRLLFGSGPRPSVFNTFPLYPNKDENSSVDTLVLDYPLSNSDDDGIRIVGSCNGLVCVVLEPRTVVLWNPATRKSKKLPISGRDIYAAEYGFGYDAVNDDYKVVEFSWIDREEVDETQVKVYSSRADSWRIMDWPNGKIVDGPGVFVNGAIHWKVHYDDRSDCDVIAQNLTTETCSVVELPVSVSGDARVLLGVSGGCLCALYKYHIYFTMDVWVMKEYGVKESWTKLVCFYHVSPRKLLFVVENGGVFLSVGSDLIMYKRSQYQEVYRLINDIEVEAATYSESLLSPGFDHYGSELGSN